MSGEQQNLAVTGYSGRVAVAKQFSIKPLIPVRPLGKPVTLYGFSHQRRTRITALIGAVAKNRESDDGGDLCPGLHVDLWQLILVLLSLWAERPLGQEQIHPGFNEVWRRYSGSRHRPSGAQREAFAAIWDELDALRMKVLVPGEPDRLVDVVHYETVRRKVNTGSVSAHCVARFAFDARFLEVVRYAHETQDVRLDVLGPIASRYVRAAYLWLPALAVRCAVRASALADRDVPVGPALRQELVGIPSKEFMGNLGAVPMSRSKRKEMLLQKGDRSILWQLHAKPMLRQGVMLGVTSWDAEDDFYIGAYTYTSDDWTPVAALSLRPKAKRGTMLYTAFVEDGGGEPAAYFYWINHGPLPMTDDYQIERLEKLGVENLKTSGSFLRMAVALLGPDGFKSVVGFLSEATITKSAGGLFRTMIKERVAKVAAARTHAYHVIMARGTHQPELPLG